MRRGPVLVLINTKTHVPVPPRGRTVLTSALGTVFTARLPRRSTAGVLLRLLTPSWTPPSDALT